MLHPRLYITLFIAITLVLSGCSSSKSVPRKPKPAPVEVPAKAEKPVPSVIEEPAPVEILEEAIEEEETPAVQIVKKSPHVMREFRAAWIATVANINWPSKSGLSVAEQQKEAIALLDFLQKHNYNAAIFQVRPQADALYESNLESWSFFLTGTQGKAPEPYYDPLQFWIEAAHDRGLELHVWLNPYRAHHSTYGPITPASIVKTHPELVVALKNGMYWLDPSKKGTQDHTAAVVMDIVNRYDIDGVHFDDYFYPYASYNKGADFPDAASYAAYLKEGGKLTKDDWRRDGVNKFVERIYKEIKAVKPKVKFGISPFGIYRPGYPKSIAGMDQFAELYADAKLWLNEGWIDYYSPQLYWKINQTKQSFPVLLGWWESENHHRRHLWPGINIDFGGDALNLDETVNQIMLTRGMVPDSKGTIHWSIGPLLKYPNISKGIVDGPYKTQALVPESPWINPILPAAPKVNMEIVDNKVNLNWHLPEGEAFKWVVYYKYNDVWNYKILNRNERNTELNRLSNGKTPLTHVGVTAVDRTGNQSSFNEIEVSPKDL
ncbi:family 10 glycosylhydrolase [Antarcticibacterium sp. 1MA-6-2]|uniref:glycoside hydrolase family 10 protein n=1 Tax=Antarcticibacterium sp. 1MA-6-2 TaxID=2908210 RepID=UPI001F41EC7B|nr:family 10 glycosylhydrolase [Antarcticibacterium sp. 1MA-6-2]UJH90137.1 family 10 glycosylhydrolase [Antarcticibacterium sp. 1MA-6-2]